MLTVISQSQLWNICLMLQVRYWLEQMFEGETVPQYEVNETTITVLYDLACKNEAVNKDTRLLLEDLGQKAEEYNAEGNDGR